MDQITMLFRVRKTVLQMLKDRGYVISEKKLTQSKEDFAAGFNGQRDSLNMLVNKRAGEATAEGEQADKLLVFFPENEKMNVDLLKRITQKMLELNVYNSIIVIKGTTQVSRKVSSTPFCNGR